MNVVHEIVNELVNPHGYGRPAARQLKEALVEAAVRAIAEQGFRGLKARALADEAGCAVGAIYNVVADLDELTLLANARTLAALERR